jgi:hypothetical protein
MKKREFLKTAGAALGGAALTGIISVEAKAEVQPQVAAGRARKVGEISIRCSRDVKIEGIHEAVRQALGFVGCPACGLLGIDLHIGGGDPEPLKLNAPGVTGGTFNAM